MSTATAESDPVELARQVVLRLPVEQLAALDSYAASVVLPGGARLSRNAAVRHLLAMALKAQAETSK